MLEFLVHKCIKDADEIERPEVRKRYGFFSSIVGIICNVILFASKLAIGLIAGSISIVSDGVNNLSDCATCIVTMFGYKMAAKPAVWTWADGISDFACDRGCGCGGWI